MEANERAGISGLYTINSEGLIARQVQLFGLTEQNLPPAGSVTGI